MRGLAVQAMVDLGDVHAQAAVDTSTAHADEDAGVDGRPGWSHAATRRLAVSTLSVLGSVQYGLESCNTTPVLLHADSLHLTSIPAQMPLFSR